MLLHCSVPSGGAGRPRTHGYDGRNKRCKPSGLHSRGVNRISAAGKYRRSREAERQALRIPEATVSPGKVLRFHGKLIHFPRKNGPEMQTEGSRAGFIGGKCIKNAIKWFTFRIGETGERAAQCSGCSPLALPGDTTVRLASAMKELFMKTAGADANRLACVKLCKSIRHRIVS